MSKLGGIRYSRILWLFRGDGAPPHSTVIKSTDLDARRSVAARIVGRRLVVVRPYCSGQTLNLWPPGIVGPSQSWRFIEKASIRNFSSNSDDNLWIISKTPRNSINQKEECAAFTYDEKNFDRSIAVCSVENFEPVAGGVCCRAIDFLMTANFAKRHFSSIVCDDGCWILEREREVYYIVWTEFQRIEEEEEKKIEMRECNRCKLYTTRLICAVN